MMMAADAGVDDAQAILIALSQPGVHVEAISAVHGNVVSKATFCAHPVDTLRCSFSCVCMHAGGHQSGEEPDAAADAMQQVRAA